MAIEFQMLDLGVNDHRHMLLAAQGRDVGHKVGLNNALAVIRNDHPVEISKILVNERSHFTLIKITIRVINNGLAVDADHLLLVGDNTGFDACVTAGAGDEALAMETVECDYDGEDLRVNFNPQYLLDGLGAIGSDTAVISFTTPTRPAVLTGKDGGDGYRYVLMPIRSAG